MFYHNFQMFYHESKHGPLTYMALLSPCEEFDMNMF